MDDKALRMNLFSIESPTRPILAWSRRINFVLVSYRATAGCTHTSSGQRRLAAFAAKGRCTRCTCLACTSTCAPRGDFPYKSPEFQPISAQSARLVHRIIVPRTFPCTSQTCTMSARGPHEIRATLLPPVQVHRQDPYEQWSHETCGVIIFVTILHDHLPISFRNRWAFICSLVM